MGIADTLAVDAESSKRARLTQSRPPNPAYGKAVRGRQGGPTRRKGNAPRSDRTLTLAWAAREYIWLYDHNHGISIDEIAAREGLRKDRVEFGVERARAIDEKSQASRYLQRDDFRSLRLIPLFPVGPYTPQSACPHLQPIEQGSTLCCMVCHSSGVDAHPALRRDPRTDPAPEPEPAPNLGLPPEIGELHETRKQRRRRMFAQQTATAPSRSE